MRVNWRVAFFLFIGEARARRIFCARAVVFRIDSCGGIVFGKMIAEHAKSGAAIQNESRAAGSCEFKTGRVSAIAPGGLVYGGRRAADSPETNLRSVFAQETLAQHFALRIISARVVNRVLVCMGN